MVSLVVLFVSLFAFATCTPDCYNFTEGITRKWNSYSDAMPPNLDNKRMDWLTIQGGKNCGFYTFSDVFFSSFNTSVLQGIYLRFVNVSGQNGVSTCSLESTNMFTYPSGSWLYANSTNAIPNVCGFYVGIANTGADTQAFQIIRAEWEGLNSTTTSSGTLLKNVASLITGSLCFLFLIL